MKVSVRKETSNKNVIGKKPLTNLYEMNSKYWPERCVLVFVLNVFASVDIRDLSRKSQISQIRSKHFER